MDMTRLYNEMINDMTKKACQHLEFDLKNFSDSFAHHAKDPKGKEALANAEKGIKEAHAKSRLKFEGTKEDALNALEYRQKLELAVANR